MPEEKGGVSSDSKLFGALCYIIGILVPLFVLFTEKKNDKFLAFHAWQSLILTVIMFVLWGGLVAATIVLSVVTMGIGGLVGCLFVPLALVFLVAVLLVAYKAYLGEMYKLPLIGDFAMKRAGGK
jgi:uncharacterized membrane protein